MMSDSLDERAYEGLPSFLESEINEKLPLASPRTISFESGSVKEAVDREFQRRAIIIKENGICLSHDKELTINEKTIAEMVKQPQGAAIIVKALAEGLAAKRLAEELTSKAEENDDRIISLVERRQEAEQKYAEECRKVRGLEKELLAALRI